MLKNFLAKPTIKMDRLTFNKHCKNLSSSRPHRRTRTDPIYYYPQLAYGLTKEELEHNRNFRFVSAEPEDNVRDNEYLANARYYENLKCQQQPEKEIKGKHMPVVHRSTSSQVHEAGKRSRAVDSHRLHKHANKNAGLEFSSKPRRGRGRPPLRNRELFPTLNENNGADADSDSGIPPVIDLTSNISKPDTPDSACDMSFDQHEQQSELPNRPEFLSIHQTTSNHLKFAIAALHAESKLLRAKLAATEKELLEFQKREADLVIREHLQELLRADQMPAQGMDCTDDLMSFVDEVMRDDSLDWSTFMHDL